MPTETVSFVNEHGVELAGRLDLPDGPPHASAIVAHCFTCSKNSRAASSISRSLRDAGFAVLRFDFTGLGDSDGAFETSTFGSNIGDVVSAADHLRSTRMAPSLLIGHSLGGTACLVAADSIPECRAVVTIGAPARASHVERLFDDRLEEIRTEGQATVSIGGRPFVIDRRFVEELNAHPIPELVASSGRALLIFHSPVDNIVGVENAAELFQAARHPKSFVSLDHADHLLTDPADGEYVAAVTSAWAQRYLPIAADGPDATGSDVVPTPGAVQVDLAGPAGFTSVVRTHRHRLMADEPIDRGGQDRGPDPYEFLGAALGTCTAMTLRMFADRKNIALEGAQVTVTHERIHAADCADCDSATGYVALLKRTIVLTGDLDDDQRALLMKIADRCPVHRTLSGEIRIETVAGAPPSA